MEMKVFLEFQCLSLDIRRSCVKLFCSRLETFLFQNLQDKFEMTELSVVVHMGALRDTLSLRGADDGHYICPILLFHLSLALGNQQETKMNACNRTRKALKGVPV
jgi:hypothetical protein